MDTPHLIVDVQAGVMTLTLDRPGKLNAIVPAVSRALLAALDRARDDPAVRAVLLRGNGRAFCAGRDITAPPTDEDLVLVQSVAQAIVALPQPVVAAVHGWTVGAGLEWMLDADIVLAASDARFKLPEASIGVFVTGGLTATLPACAGLARAKALMLLGEEFTARQAQDWGLVWRVVEPDALAAEAQRAAAHIAALDPGVVRRFKRVLNTVGLPRFSRAIALESEAQAALAGRP